MREAARVLLLCAWVCVSAAAPGCQRPSEADDGKRMPKPPPAPSASSSVRIEVQIDGQPAPAIDAARLAAVAPDYQDEDRQAWKLTTLLGEMADREGTTFAATGEQGATLVMKRPDQPDEPAPVLVVTRRGEAVMAMIKPGEPFPSYHGRGARLGRPGDPRPRIGGVTKIALSVSP